MGRGNRPVGLAHPPILQDGGARLDGCSDGSGGGGDRLVDAAGTQRDQSEGLRGNARFFGQEGSEGPLKADLDSGSIRGQSDPVDVDKLDPYDDPDY